LTKIEIKNNLQIAVKQVNLLFFSRERSMRIFRRKTKEEKIQKGIEGLKGNKDGLMLLLRMVSQDPHKTTILSMVLKEENVTLDDLEYLLVLTQKQDILRQIREIILKKDNYTCQKCSFHEEKGKELENSGTMMQNKGTTMMNMGNGMMGMMK